MARTVALLATLAISLACAKSDDRSSQTQSPSPSSAPKPKNADIPVGMASVVFTNADGKQAVVYVDVAREPGELQRGLMYRRHMGWNRGMVFLFTAEEQQSFWMKNTLIPLDMIFVRSDMTVLGVVHNAEPRTLTSRRVEGLSQFVVETNAGWAKEHNIGAGAQVKFVDVD